MTHHPDPTPQRPRRRPDWRWTLALGLLLILGGIVALLNPFAASLTAVAIAAVVFMLAGVLQLWIAFNGGGETGGRVALGLLGLLILAFGVSLMANPLAGLLSLTLLVGLFFVGTGVVRLWIGLSLRTRPGWGWLAGSGAVSLALGLMILVFLPEAAPGLLGLFLGVDLLTSGAGATALALHLRHG
ncbi:HdeD family acid-resistance protein [Salipiger marinus]|uniref:Uncharacterized membrane protein HdeD, DUF308 family n=1 Tax=Salipiger marinus TaxID=555512 RepID=A0A1G8HUQ5_9RHOB|nr:DUF308 domain-containing protein [Salipiger marinus]SDI10386.1 Uncharacterized membrane protein HdeD, DUF308 family [Salipiger marinus]